jgi:hypothetical protein
MSASESSRRCPHGCFEVYLRCTLAEVCGIIVRGLPELTADEYGTASRDERRERASFFLPPMTITAILEPFESCAKSERLLGGQVVLHPRALVCEPGLVRISGQVTPFDVFNAFLMSGDLFADQEAELLISFEQRTRPTIAVITLDRGLLTVYPRRDRAE